MRELPSIKEICLLLICEVMHNSWNYFKGHCVKNVEVFEKSERKNPGLQAFTDFQKKNHYFYTTFKTRFQISNHLVTSNLGDNTQAEIDLLIPNN